MDMILWVLPCTAVGLIGVFLWELLPEETFWPSWLELNIVLLHFLFHGTLKLFQALWWRVNGVHNKLRWSESDDGYEQCVQVRRIVARLRFPQVNHPRPWDFTSVHDCFTQPSDLLLDNVSLYCITLTHAHLVISPADVDLYSSKTSPFLKRAQFKHATKVMIIPIRHFYRVCSEIGDPQCPVSWINNCGRCGSTLVTQMLETIPNMRSISEPDVTTNISVLSKTGQISDSEAEVMWRATIRYMCRAAPGVNRISVKVRYTCIPQANLVQRLFPNIKHIFLYRDLGPVMFSFYKFIHRDLAVCILENIVNSQTLSFLQPKVKLYLTSMIAKNGPFDEDILRETLSKGTFMGYSTAIICSNTAVFKHQLETGIIRDVPTLHYDELLKNPLTMVKIMFKHLDIPDKYAAGALDALQRDSQAGDIASNLDNGSGSCRSSSDIPQTDKDSIDATLLAMGLPHTNQRLEMPFAL